MVDWICVLKIELMEDICCRVFGFFWFLLNWDFFDSLFVIGIWWFWFYWIVGFCLMEFFLYKCIKLDMKNKVLKIEYMENKLGI